ncbi:TetR/AcrR family transcriptional regulator [Streptomyces sp. NBC_01317]|uniref:TetR/AcrR family transcriptional regulator n=1 Tax=Streptomyces sp. NBC_01317 TaxID=2903822 RepID=UPI002E12404C|nr:TetR/AcrR family transcriptional regulator [Streptomyces sp. NBC_01317]
MLSGHGADVPMERIAREAGVAVGTIYRHFPDRQALLQGIATDALRDLLEFSRAATDGEGPRGPVLTGIVGHCMGLPLALVKSLAEAPVVSPGLSGLQGEFDDLLRLTVTAAQEEGALRRDLSPAEIVDLIQVMVCRPGARFDDPMTRVMLDGLRPATGP